MSLQLRSCPPSIFAAARRVAFSLLACFGLVLALWSNHAAAATPQVAAGYFHTLAIRADGTLWTWGQNSSGVLGLGDSANRLFPTQVGSATNWTRVAAGSYHTLAIRSDGSLWAWGLNFYGQLGLGDNANRNLPTRVGTDNNWRTVTGGGDYTLALRTDGTLWAWGYNASGQLGLGNNTDRNLPMQVGVATDWDSLATGEAHSLARRTDGTLWAWGSNVHGQLGLGDTIARNLPTQIGAGANWTTVAAGGQGRHSVARQSDGKLWAWGLNSSGQLGLGDNTDRNLPTQIGTATNWESMATGTFHTLARRSDGTLWAWGSGGATGFNDGANRNVPEQVGAATNWAGLAAGSFHSVALHADGSFWAWGNNEVGQLGDATSTDRLPPKQIGTASTWSYVPKVCQFVPASGQWSTAANWGGDCANTSVPGPTDRAEISGNKIAILGDFESLEVGDLYLAGATIRGATSESGARLKVLGATGGGATWGSGTYNFLYIEIQLAGSTLIDGRSGSLTISNGILHLLSGGAGAYFSAVTLNNISQLLNGSNLQLFGPTFVLNNGSSYSDLSTASMSVNNNLSVELNGGSTWALNGLLAFDFVTLSFSANSIAAFQVNSGARVVFIGGTIYAPTGVLTNGGEFNILVAGEPTIQVPTFINAGILDIGTSFFVVDGNYTQSETGQLKVTIEDNEGTNYGRLLVGGTADFSAAINKIELDTSEYTSSPGEQFDFVYAQVDVLGMFPDYDAGGFQVQFNRVQGVGNYILRGTVGGSGPSVLTVTNLSDSGPGSLREAMTTAQTCANEPFEIQFNIPGGGTISPATPLPTVLCTTTFNGWSNPGSADNTSTTDWNGVVPVALNGAGCASGTCKGLVYTAPGSAAQPEIRGLRFENWQAAVEINNTVGQVNLFGNFFTNNNIGVNALTIAVVGDGWGSQIRNVFVNNTVGVDVTGTQAIVRYNAIGLGAGGAPGGNGVGVRVSGPTDVFTNYLDGNVFAYNNKGLVIGSSASDTRVRVDYAQNAPSVFYNNTVMAVDLGDDGPTPNDALDADSGPNFLINTPIVTSATDAGANVGVNVTYSGKPNTQVKVFVCGSDVSTRNECKQVGANATANTDASGVATFAAFSIPKTGIFSGPVRVNAFACNVQSAIAEYGSCSEISAGVNTTAGVAPTITSGPPPGGTVGAAYAYTVTATGSTPITWSVTSGTLPPGLTLDSGTGTISGTPTTSGSFTFTLQAANGTLPNATTTPTIVIAPAPIITTVAGNGTASYSGDGAAATSASLNGPSAVAVDSAGNLYIADPSNHRIRKVTVGTGVITTVAGNGTAGFSGDGAAATSASLNVPTGVAVDIAGNIYIADRLNQRIRKVTAATGFISTVAGNGTSGFSGDGAAATSASLDGVGRLSVDSAGNVYFGDRFNNRVRKVTVASGIITTVAGNGVPGFAGDGGPATSASLNNTFGTAVDSAGNLYLVDPLNNRVRKVTAATGIITTVAGDGNSGSAGDGGAATSASFTNPLDVAVDGAGNLYIADQTSSRVRKVTAATGIITTVAGNGSGSYSGDGGPAINAGLAAPVGLAIDGSGNLYIADSTGSNRIRKVSTGSIVLPQAITFGANPGPVTYAPSGTFTVSATGGASGNAVTFTSTTTGVCTTSGTNGATVTIVTAGPCIIAADQAGNAGYSAAPQVTQTITINKANQATLIATSTATTVTVGQTATLGTTGGSGTGAVSYVSGSPNCNITGTTLTGVSVGSCTVTATKATDANYNAATGTVTITVTIGSQSITFGTAPTVTVGGTGTVSATGGASGNPVTFTSTTPAVCTVAGSTVTGVTAGTCTIAGNQAGNANYSAAPQVTLTFSVTAALLPQSITFTNTPRTFSGCACSISATGGASGNPVLFSSLTPAVCSVGGVFGNTITGLTAGTCTIAANQAGNASYNAAPQITQSLTVGAAPIGARTFDFDGDKRSDILLKNNIDSSAYGWQMDGLNVIGAGALIGANTPWTITHTGDVNGDGKADILWRHTDGRIVLWIMNGLTVTTTKTLAIAASGLSITHVTDLNGDGKADLSLTHTAGTVTAWLMDGINTTATQTLLGAGSGWSVTHAADLNGDGKADLLLEHTDGRVYFWLMDGINIIGANLMLDAGTGWSISHTADLNGDGKADVLWRHTDGAIYAWLMNGLTIPAANLMVSAGAGWSITHTADLDGDGKTDILFQNTDGSIYGWTMDGLNITTGGFLIGPGSGWSVSHVRDMSGDCRVDILLKHTDGRVYAWIMDGLNVLQGGLLFDVGATWRVAP
jgi:alpha-tubulin suppressor-like RCC1 family protein